MAAFVAAMLEQLYIIKDVHIALYRHNHIYPRIHIIQKQRKTMLPITQGTAILEEL